MINDKLKKAIKRIDFNKHARQRPYCGLNHLKDWGDRLFIETGGGGTAEMILGHISESGGKLITIDLCHKPRISIKFKDETTGLSGDGDYSSKVELYKQMENEPEIMKVWEYHNIDAYTFFEKVYTGPIEYYFDDGTHYSGYLIPLFKDFIIPRAVSGAIIGTHDRGDPQMIEFVKWLKEHERVDKVIDRDASTLMVILK